MDHPTLFDRHLHLRRNSDPDTSDFAAQTAHDKHPDDRVADLVVQVMRDGIRRIDEEIWNAIRTSGHKLTEQRIRAGRKRAVERGQISLTGRRRRTSAGGISREWAINSLVCELDRCRVISRKFLENF